MLETEGNMPQISEIELKTEIVEKCAALAESFKGWIGDPKDQAMTIARAIRELWKPKMRVRRRNRGG
jgi:hypothetical protein